MHSPHFKSIIISGLVLIAIIFLLLTRNLIDPIIGGKLMTTIIVLLLLYRAGVAITNHDERFKDKY